MHLKTWSKLKALFRRRSREADMAEEMRLHLEQRMEEHMADGMSPAEARYAALRKFGGVEQAKELARDQRTWVWLEQLRQDVRFAVRGLGKARGFTVVATLTLGLGIGLNTSIFTAVQAALLPDVPYPQPERLVQVFRTSPHSQRWPHAPANFLDQQAQNDVFEAMAAFTAKPFNLAAPGQAPERIAGVLASAEVFSVLGIQPMLGRVFTNEEDHPGSNRVAVLDHEFWLRRFAGDPAVLGRTVRIDGETVTVIGVMPPLFHHRLLFGPSEIWMPLALTAAQRRDRDGNYLKSIARLKPGVTLAQAQAAMALVAERQAREHPDSNSGIGLRLVPLTETMDPRGRVALWATMALAGFVLLIACANLANLQLARTARRTQELAIRRALGASRSRLLRQLLTESVLLALLGGTLGLVLAHWGNEILARQIGPSANLVLAVNWRVLGFALATSTWAGFAFGVIPAWLASRADANEAIKQGGRGAIGDRSGRRVQHILIVAEVALALVLLAVAGVMARGLQRFMAQSPGWTVDGVLVGNLNLPTSHYGTADAQCALVDQLEKKLETLPGVDRVAIAWTLPVRQFDTAGGFVIGGRPLPPPGREPIRHVDGITPGYFATLGIALRAGREFTADDREGRPEVVMINEAMARAFWPGASPLGQHVDGEEVVGVVDDVRAAADPSEPDTRFQTYRPFAQAPRGTSIWVALHGTVTADVLRRTVAEIDSDLPVNEAGPARALVDRSLVRLGAVGWLLNGFGALGLLLASLGIYGVLAGFVAYRTKEIGLRMAIGAQWRDVLWLVLGQGLRLTAFGALIGLTGAVAGARLLSSIAPELGASAPLAICGMTALLLTVAMLACWVPAHRAARIDPMTALRAE